MISILKSHLASLQFTTPFKSRYSFCVPKTRQEMDGSMFCPQCGTLNQDDAVSCHNCGTSLNDIGNLNEKPISEKVRALSLVMAIASLGMGILSFWPYPYLAYDFYDFPILRPFLHSSLNLGCLGGFPLGLISIVLGVLAWRRSQKNIIVVSMAVIGILLSIGGIVGHLWFIVTCQFCQ